MGIGPIPLDHVEVRVLGCLVEKQRTTPDAYPLTLNALRLACNQATNRDPVADFGEPEIRRALASLSDRRFTRLASGSGSRTAKYRHILGETLGLEDADLALLAVLMLRGAQTPGELKQRCERLHRFANLGDLQLGLQRLIDAELVLRLPRRPGQKEERYAHLLAGDDEDQELPATPAGVRAHRGETSDHASGPPLEERLERVESELARLRRSVEELRAAAREG